MAIAPAFFCRERGREVSSALVGRKLARKRQVPDLHSACHPREALHSFAQSPPAICWDCAYPRRFPILPTTISSPFHLLLRAVTKKRKVKVESGRISSYHLHGTRWRPYHHRRPRSTIPRQRNGNRSMSWHHQGIGGGQPQRRRTKHPPHPPALGELDSGFPLPVR
jgi:hypothetical protein